MTTSEGERLGLEAADRLARTGRYEIAPGLTDSEITRIEHDHGFEFAEDHRAFLQAGLPLNRPKPGRSQSNSWPDWRDGDSGLLRAKLSWPVDGALFDIEHNAVWLDAWGERPDNMQTALGAARQQLIRVPRMIPVYSHRYLPAGRDTFGHPVLSMVQTDIIIYGVDLVGYIDHEFNGDPPDLHTTGQPIPFWSDFL